MLKRSAYMLALCLCGGLLLWPSIASAADPVAKGAAVRDFYRLTFEWGRPTYITAGVDGQTLVINAERPFGGEVASAIQSLGGLVRSHRISADGQTLTMELNGSYRARSFLSGLVSGVDVIPSRNKQSPAKVISIAPAASPQKARIMAKKSEDVISLAQLAPAANLPAEGEKTEADAAVPPQAESVPPSTPQVPQVPQVSAPDAPVKPEAEPKADAPAVLDVRVPKSEEPAVAAEPQSKQSKQNKQPPKETEAVTDKAMPAAKPAPPVEPKKVVKPEVQQAPPGKAEESKPEVQKPATVQNEQESKSAAAQPAKAQDEQTNATSPEPAAVAAQPEALPAENPEPEASTPQEATEGDGLTKADEPSEPSEATPTSPTEQRRQWEQEQNSRIPNITVRAKLDNEVLDLQFPWQKRTAAAAYIRRNMAWIVFNHPSELDFKQVNSLLRSGGTIKQMPSSEATIIYVPVSSGAGIKMTNIEGTFRWEVSIIPGQRTSDQPVKVELQTEPPLKPHVFLPLLDVANIVRIKDPSVGDELDVLPVYEANKGVSPARYFPEFSLLDTVQGLAVLRKSDRTTVDLIRNGVRVSTQQGAIISPNLPLPEDAVDEQAEGEAGVLLPYNRWKVSEGKNYTEEIELIRRKIGRGLAQSEADSYLRLAEIHLAYGEAVEAIGYLNNIKRIAPDFFISEKLSAMQGAANFLLQRYSDAARNFRVPELKVLEEVQFWQVMLAELLGKPTRQFDYESSYEPYIQYYPPILRQRIGIFAADRAISNKDHNAALKIFDQLNEHKLINEVADYINYLMGKIAVDNDQLEDGYKIWTKIVEGPATEFVKVRAEFALIVEKMRHDEITTPEAVNRLERLAIRWRGDNLELAVLSTLSSIYEKAKAWPHAIRIWRSMDEAFPNTIEAVEASRKMDEAFIAMFDRGETAGINQLDLMFLYNEYSDLVPDDEVGDRIVEKLATLMVDMDMLKQAEDMLEDRMRYRFEHVDRSKVGAKLAEVYLLDKKPQKALNALQLSVFGILPESLLHRRTYLNAQALLSLRRYSDLFQLLKGDEGPEADYYRLQAHWHAKDWKALAESGEKLLKKRQNPTARLSDLEVDALVKLALAYVATGEKEQISYLREYFRPLMEGESKAKLFTYLTQPYLTLTPDNFDEVVQVLDQSQAFLASDYGKDEVATDEEAAAQGG